METTGKNCNDLLCKSESELHKGGDHATDAHQVFGGMPTQFEVFEEDVLLVVREEKMTRDEALHLLREEWIEAKRRHQEKLDCLVEMFGMMEDRSNKISDEFSTSNMELTTATEAETSSSVQAPHSPTPASCSTMCPNDRITLAMVSSSHISEQRALTAAFELGVGENKGGADHTRVAFQTMMGLSKGVPAYIQPLVDFEPRPTFDIKPDKLTPTRCSVKFSRHDNKVLMTMTHLDANPWPPPTPDELVDSICELRSELWPTLKFSWAVLHLMMP